MVQIRPIDNPSTCNRRFHGRGLEVTPTRQTEAGLAAALAAGKG